MLPNAAFFAGDAMWAIVDVPAIDTTLGAVERPVIVIVVLDFFQLLFRSSHALSCLSSGTLALPISDGLLFSSCACLLCFGLQLLVLPLLDTLISSHDARPSRIGHLGLFSLSSSTLGEDLFFCGLLLLFFPLGSFSFGLVSESAGPLGMQHLLLSTKVALTSLYFSSLSLLRGFDNGEDVWC
jgi:hypothetical protein